MERTPGLEPGPKAWKALMLAIKHHVRLFYKTMVDRKGIGPSGGVRARDTRNPITQPIFSFLLVYDS